MLDRKAALPLYAQLEKLLRKQIEDGELNSGDRLPSEPELASVYGISRMTVRKALDSLASSGLVVRHAGKGTYVARAKMPIPLTMLTSFSSTMRVLGLSVSSRVLELKQMTAPPHVAAALGLSTGSDVIFLKRLRLIDDAPMALHRSYMPASIFAPLLHEDLTTRPITDVMETMSGLRIIASSDHIEASAARPDEAEMLNLRNGAPVLLERGVVYASNGLPVRCSVAVYRGDRFRLAVSAEKKPTAEVRLPEKRQRPDSGPDLGDEWLTLSFSLAE